MKRPLLLVTAAAALLASIAPAAHAAEKEGAAKPAPAKLTPEQQADIQRAAIIFRLFNTAFVSKEVEQPVKAKLLSCMFSNSLGNISVAAGRAMKQNGRDEKSTTEIYRAAAGVCGVGFKAKEAANGAAPKPTAKPGGEGR